MGTYDVIPSNEIQTREWFAFHLSEFDYSIVASGAAYPDYTLKDSGGNIQRTEIEYDSYNFQAHGHDPKKCDLVLCWIHTLPLPLPVLELSTRKLFAANDCDVARTPVDERYVVKKLKRSTKERKQQIAAIQKADSEYREFVRCIGADIIEYERIIKLFQPTRLKLLAAQDCLVHQLRLNGYNVDTLHPYDLMLTLRQLVES